MLWTAWPLLLCAFWFTQYVRIIRVQLRIQLFRQEWKYYPNTNLSEAKADKRYIDLDGAGKYRLFQLEDLLGFSLTFFFHSIGETAPQRASYQP
jgi:hypothetical protein